MNSGKIGAGRVDGWRIEGSTRGPRGPKNFLILMEDNIHSIGSGSETAWMIMAYGGGPLKEKFLKGEIGYNPNEYFIHANATDFTRELPQVNPSQEVPTNQKKRRLSE